MNYKEMLQNRFELNERELAMLSEETAKTILCYIQSCKYQNVKGIVYPHSRHYWRLSGPNGTMADLFFDADKSEVLLVECPGEEQYIIDSQTKFNRKTRVDYIKCPNSKDILFTSNGYLRVDYVEEGNLRPYFRAFHHDTDVEEDLALETKLPNKDDEDYEKLLWIKGQATKIRKEKHAIRTPWL